MSGRDSQSTAFPSKLRVWLDDYASGLETTSLTQTDPVWASMAARRAKEVRAWLELPDETSRDAGELALTRNALSNLYMAVMRFGPIDAGIRFAMGEAGQLLGGPHPQVKTPEESSGKISKEPQ